MNRNGLIVALFMGMTSFTTIVAEAQDKKDTPPAKKEDKADLKPISAAEAAKKVNEKVVVEMEVKSSGGTGNVFLNSESNFRDDNNFTVFIPKEAAEKFQKAKIEDPAKHFKGKMIRVKGTVTLFQKKAQIKVEDPEQIEIVEKK
jgi:DNA/RNA endonuclease YhcR with UshA esterase domain